MWLFYLLSLIPLFTGFFLWYKYQRIVWWEWLASFGISLLTAAIFHLCCNLSIKNNDTETWSGQVRQSRQYSSWREYYEEAIYRTEHYTDTESYTDSKGNRSTRTVSKSRRVFDHWEPRRRWHSEHWIAFTTLNNINISKQKHLDISKKFNDLHSIPGDRTTMEHNSRMIEGDPNDYVSDNKTKWIEPVTTIKTFENRIKAGPSLFSFIKVPTNISVYEWPSNPDPFKSDRLLGTATVLIDKLKWDQLNSYVGPSKRVNLIMIGFGNKDSSYGQYQQAKFIGGKKNDVIITFGSGSKTTPASWAFVFGWTEKELVKRRLESLLLNNPINNDLIDKIKDEVILNYTIKDWTQFSYLEITPPTWSYYVFFFVLIGSQCVVWYGFFNNSIDKNGFNDTLSYNRTNYYNLHQYNSFKKKQPFIQKLQYEIKECWKIIKNIIEFKKP